MLCLQMDSQFDELKKERDSTSQDSGIQGSMHDVRPISPDTRRHGATYNPNYYQEDVSGLYMLTLTYSPNYYQAETLPREPFIPADGPR